jgi:hypothetical protein
MRAFWARIVANVIQKFKTQSLAVMLQMMQRHYVDSEEQWHDNVTIAWWRYADRSNDVTWTRH